MRRRRNSRVRGVVIVVLVLVGFMGGNLLGARIQTAVWVGFETPSQGAGSEIFLKYLPGSSEGKDPLDIELIQKIAKIEAYFVIPGYLLIENSKDPNSTTDSIAKFEKTGSSVYGNEEAVFVILDSNGLEWKNIFVERYGKNGDINEPNDILSIWDVKYKDGTGWFFTGGISDSSPGVYEQFKYKVFNYSDLNRDKKVNFKDYAIFANNFGRTDPNCGADPNNLDDYSDIDRSGVVDYNDLSLFTNEWLWDANDPNTW